MTASVNFCRRKAVPTRPGQLRESHNACKAPFGMSEWRETSLQSMYLVKAINDKTKKELSPSNCPTCSTFPRQDSDGRWVGDGDGQLEWMRQIGQHEVSK